MTLSQIRNRIHALRRKYALPITVIRLRPYATLFCDQWAIARDRKQPPPDTGPFIMKLVDSRLRFTTFTNLHHRLSLHRDNNTCPHPIDIVTALIPDLSSRPIIDAVLRRDPPAEETPPPPTLCFTPPSFIDFSQKEEARLTTGPSNTFRLSAGANP